MLFHMAEYCGTPQSKERSNGEYKVCLSERAILRLLDAPTRENGVILRVLRVRALGLVGLALKISALS